MTGEGLQQVNKSELWHLRLSDAVRRFWRDGKPPTTYLDCVTRDGREFQLELESDPGFASFANVLHMITRINRGEEKGDKPPPWKAGSDP